MTLTGLDAGAGLATVCVEITEDTALGLGLTLNRFAKYSSSQPNSVSLSCSERFDQSIPTLDTTDAADGVRIGRGGDGVALVEDSWSGRVSLRMTGGRLVLGVGPLLVLPVREGGGGGM